MAKAVRARIYSVDEARAILPRVRALMDSLQATREEIVALQPQVWPFLRSKISNGGNAQLTDLTEQFARLTSAVEQITDLGILVKDIDEGIVDFLFVRQGKRVYLCWKHGEEDITHWHDINAGFAARQPIDETDFDDDFEGPL